MNKTNQFIEILGISSIILIGNRVFTTARKVAQASDSTLDKTAEIITQDCECISSNNKLNPSDNSATADQKIARRQLVPLDSQKSSNCN